MSIPKPIALTNGMVILEEEVLDGGGLLLREGRIERVLPPSSRKPGRCGRVIDVGGRFISPGFIDLHVHGAGGLDFIHGEPEGAATIASIHARHGTTSLLATVRTSALERMMKAVEEAAGSVGRELPGAEILGIHLEGPYLNPRRCGAHPVNHIRRADRREFQRILEKGAGRIRIVTIAPEVKGGMELLDLICREGLVASIGHSEASFEEAEEAISRGVSYVTHTFNAMSGLHHRQPGVAAAALLHDVYVEMILDGVHVSPQILEIAARAKSPERMVLVTDCMEAMENATESFFMNGRRVTVKEGAPRFENGVLCGSVLTMNRTLKNATDFLGKSVPEVLPWLTRNPARAIGMEGRKGSLTEGHDADVTVFDEADEISLTIVGGRIVYEKKSMEE